MEETEENEEANTSDSNDLDKTEVFNSNGTLHYAFIYCTIFLVALIVALQFEPLVGYRYPVLLLVAAVFLLFIGVSFQESKIKRGFQWKKQSLSVMFLIITATCLILVLMIIPESPVLFLLVPLALGILFLEWLRARCKLHNDST